jgi:hypothetical protein
MRPIQSTPVSPLSVAYRANFWREAVSLLAAAVGLVIGLAPRHIWACACGCGVYEVGTASLFPHSGGGTVWLEYDFQDQYLNWHATQVASAGANSDKKIRTHFLTLHVQSRMESYARAAVYVSLLQDNR